MEELFTSETYRFIKAKLKETILNEGITIDEKEVLLPTVTYWLKTMSHIITKTPGQILGVLFILQDITEKKEMERKLLNTIIETEEKERMYFAQELHDGLGPLISAAKMYIQCLTRPETKMSQQEIIKDTEQLINEASETIREISFKLSPHILENFGLIEALNAFKQKVTQSGKIEISLNYNFSSRFDETIETVIYRALCECINNTIKHAHASKIEISIFKFISKTKITYCDNGVGFDMEEIYNRKNSNGIFSLHSRLQSINGSTLIDSQPGNGVKIKFIIKHLENSKSHHYFK
jgi:signal transduction histidine kinase